MSQGGWIKLYRTILESPIWLDSRKLKLWLLCMLKASHKEHKQLIGNQVVKLKPGEFVTGREALAEEYNKDAKKEQRVSGDSLFRWLELFKTMQMLHIKKTTKYTVISIDSWEKCQGIAQHLHSKCTASAQQLHTNKNVKNEKEIKDIVTSEEISNKKKKDNSAHISEIVTYLNEKAGTNYRDSTEATKQAINARLQEGFTVNDFKKVINIKTKEWLRTEMVKYLRPSTLFSPTKFEQYLNQKEFSAISSKERLDLSD